LNKQKENENKIITQEIIQDKCDTYVSEVQYFEEPEDYDDAFKIYYPKRKEKI